jgi:hypothetical protein
MQARSLCAIMLVGFVVGGVAMSAGAQPVQPVGAEPPTTRSLLQPLDRLAGESIAQGINSPDTPYAPDLPNQGLGSDGTGGALERTTSVNSGHLFSQVIVTIANEDRSANSHRGTATAKVDLCPNRDGSVSGNVEISIASGAGLDATEQTARATFTGKVDDAANLASSSVATPGSSGAEKKALENFAKQVLRNAEQGWRNGYCVKIEVLEGGSRGVKPKEDVAVSAKAIQRFDGSTIDGPMTAKLAGKKQIKPASSAESPAAFTYTAPDKSPGKGDVTLRSTSRRGIGTAKLHYTAGGDLKIDTAQGPAHFTAVKCGGPVGAWSLHVVADFGPVKSDETVGFTLDEDLKGPAGAGGVAFGPPGAANTEASGLAIYDPVAKSLTIPGWGSLPVAEGDFCK